jgi:hypothetical protein
MNRTERIIELRHRLPEICLREAFDLCDRHSSTDDAVAAWSARPVPEPAATTGPATETNPSATPEDAAEDLLDSGCTCRQCSWCGGLSGAVARVMGERDAARKEAAELRATLSELAATSKAHTEAAEALKASAAEAFNENARLRARLAALTDPSPAAQLRRYREASKAAEKLAVWAHDSDGKEGEIRSLVGGDILAEYWTADGMDGQPVCYRQKGSPRLFADTVQEAITKCAGLATAAGWQLVNE